MLDDGNYGRERYAEMLKEGERERFAAELERNQRKARQQKAAISSKTTGIDLTDLPSAELVDEAQDDCLSPLWRQLHDSSQRPLSLEMPVGEEEDSSLGDFVEDKNAVSPQDAVIHSNLAEQTRSVLSTLAPREARVLKMRFGIGERDEHTLEEVGQVFQVTRERIRQIEAKALRKLRHSSRSKHLKSFIEQ